MADSALSSFAYRAQTQEGSPISGTIDAAGVEQATASLQSLQLRIIDIQPAPASARPRALRGEDFIAFNQQLAHLTAAGLPMEQGLRLIAEDMRSGRLSQTIRQIADELEQGKSLTEVFERQRGRFPFMYGRLLEAGVRSNNLSGMLFNLSGHLELVRRLRSMIWSSIAYPLMVFIALAALMGFLGLFVLPRFQAIFDEMRVGLPLLTRIVLSVSPVMPIVAVAALGSIVVGPMLWMLLRRMGLDGAARDRLAFPLPLVGPVVQRSVIAAWCDALRLGIEAGLDLSSAIELAGDASGSPAVRGDSLLLVDQLQAGKDLMAAGRGSVLPRTVVAAISMGIRQHDLPATLRSLAEMYQQQAETRLAALPGILTPIFLILMAALVGLAIAAMLLPILSLISAVSGGGKF